MLKKLKEEKLYIILALLFGLIFVFLIPPFQSPDEHTHFKKAYAISTGQFYNKVNSDGVLGNDIPSNILQYANDKLGFMGNRDRKFSYSYFVLDLQTLTPSNEKTTTETIDIIPIIYSIPALGIIISKIVAFIMGISITIPAMLYGARLVSLLVYSLICYYSIKIIPKYKKSLMVFLLLPMTLFLFCSVSYDNVLISLSALLFALVIKYRYDNKLKYISIKDFIIISFIALVYINLKKIYVLNLLLLLLIPKNKFAKNKKDFIIKAGIFLFAILMLSRLMNIFIPGTVSVGETSSLASEQISFVVNNPISYLKIYFSELFHSRFYYLSTFVGVFGLLDTYLPYPIVFLYLLFIIITLVLDGNDSKNNILIKEKFLSYLVHFGIISLAFLGLYIGWTSFLSGYGVGAKSISGVQGRYFIPAMFALIPVFSNKFKWKGFIKLKELYNDNYQYIYILVLSISLISILLRFWV